MPFKYPTMEDRLIANSVISTENFFTHHDGEVTPCWEWVGPRNSVGYPAMSVRAKRGPRKGKVIRKLVHRLSLVVFRGRVLTGKSRKAMHLCNNKNCINPMHLEGGTQRQNILQCVKDGRHGNKYRAPVNGRREVTHDYASLGADSRSVCMGAGRDRLPVEEVAHVEEELAEV